MENRFFCTCNRRDEPPTTDLEEWIDGKPTGKIVTGYGFNAAGEFVVDYKLVFEIDESQNDFHDDQQLPLYDVSDNNLHYKPNY